MQFFIQSCIFMQYHLHFCWSFWKKIVISLNKYVVNSFIKVVIFYKVTTYMFILQLAQCDEDSTIWLYYPYAMEVPDILNNWFLLSV